MLKTACLALLTAGPLHAAALDTEKLNQILHTSGTVVGVEYKATFPQRDLTVKVDGIEIAPAMGLTTWVAFAPAGREAMVMGDIVILEDELPLVERVMQESGLTATSIHNHFLRDQPKVMFLHVSGDGPGEELARGVRAIFNKIAGLRAAKGMQTREPEPTPNRLDDQALAVLLGATNPIVAGRVVKFVIARPEVNVSDMDRRLDAFMGFNSWIAFTGSMEKSAVTGDFALLEGEVRPVIAALISRGIEVTAVHNHMTGENPRIFFLHYWGTGSATVLARNLKAALDQTRRR